MLRRNLIANYLGQGWRTLISLVFLPLYIHYLGIEAYGLISIFGILQAWLILLDMGLKPALGREMARYCGGAHDVQSIRNLLRTIETITVPVACLIALTVFSASGWLATNWVSAVNISHQEVANAFALMGVMTSLQFVQSLYTSSISGLQKQVLLNVILNTTATIRSVGAIAVLVWISASLDAFFIWQAAVSLADVLIAAIVVYRVLPSPPKPARSSWATLHAISHYAGGRIAIVLLGLLLSYTDRILLARLLPLTIYGYYALASVVSGTLITLVGPVIGAYWPRFVELHARDDLPELGAAYHQSAQILTVILGPAAVILILFADRVLMLWTGDAQLTAQVAPLLIVLAYGNFLNGLLLIPLQMQFAYGWTSLNIKMNVVAVAFVVPALFLLVPKFGAIAAAWVWVLLNLVYITIGTYLMHRRILKREQWKWYGVDIALPLAVASLTGLTCRWIMPSHLSRLGELAVIVTSSVITLAFTALSIPFIRRRIFSHPLLVRMCGENHVA